MAAKIAVAVQIFFRVIEILILVRVILSWIPFRTQNAFVVFIHSVTEPILGPIRNLVSRSSFGKNLMFDVSPILAYVVLGVVRHIIILILAKL
ncbi:MAG TPA: YggT family protein [Ruminiclostridium sp.]|jgi:YggT family protein|nr:YggT family protein [Clostridiaceae bacterium]HAA24656.1 YggT family protein [Ruminiclostridium sp.]